ncbi:hypothetical protein [Sabulicella glaciei]|uniref:Uncharacterized protein n=1 Tax=Sabulicella glaciei TaxID=2984948 RepID=A0ABT3NRC5_9PROT|nr:hypothetical protein [Roseococcus sp. MDT2-1-1]MCW8084718.1 hypothetical protein [Roseococcus sp. MDT2-1-1]
MFEQMGPEGGPRYRYRGAEIPCDYRPPRAFGGDVTLDSAAPGTRVETILL